MKMKDFKPAHFNWHCKDDVAVITLKGSERKNPITSIPMSSCATPFTSSPPLMTSRPWFLARTEEISAQAVTCTILSVRCSIGT